MMINIQIVRDILGGSTKFHQNFSSSLTLILILMDVKTLLDNKIKLLMTHSVLIISRIKAYTNKT